MTRRLTIVGAGYAGLLAAHAWRGAAIVEAAFRPEQKHKALLRFRTDAVARLVGIPFRPVTVRKGIWQGHGFAAPSIAFANAYSMKVLGELAAERSIWSLEPAIRYIAPETLHEQMVDHVAPRIRWGETFKFADDFGRDHHVVSTAPLDVTLRAVNGEPPAAGLFRYAPIFVQTFRLPQCDVFQTVYFPTDSHSVYRASITGSLLIVEHAGDPRGVWDRDVEQAFSLRPLPAGSRLAKQSRGKIAPFADDAQRKALLLGLTVDHKIYSLGRFATWRNILLDDVVDDIDIVRRLIDGNGYDTRRAMA